MPCVLNLDPRRFRRRFSKCVLACPWRVDPTANEIHPSVRIETERINCAMRTSGPRDLDCSVSRDANSSESGGCPQPASTCRGLGWLRISPLVRSLSQSEDLVRKCFHAYLAGSLSGGTWLARVDLTPRGHGSGSMALHWASAIDHPNHVAATQHRAGEIGGQRLEAGCRHDRSIHGRLRSSG